MSETVAIIALIFLLVLILTFLQFVRGSKSYQYRKFLTNMYVSARIRFLAKEDNLDLEEEEKIFKKYLKVSKDKRDSNLDNEVEEELMDRVDRVSEKKDKK